MRVSPSRFTALIFVFAVSFAHAQENSQPSIEQKGKFCNQVNTGAGSNNCTIIMPSPDNHQNDGNGSPTPYTTKEPSYQEKFNWEKLGFNKKTVSSIPVYIYPGIQHDRDGQIAEGLKRLLSSKIKFSDKYHAALFLRVVDANVYYVSPLDAEDEPKGYAGFQVDLQWADGGSLPPVVAGAQTNSIAGNLPRNEALQVNAMNLAISQACRKIISMAGDNPKDC